MAVDWGKALQKIGPIPHCWGTENRSYFRKDGLHYVSVTLNAILPDIKITLPLGCSSLVIPGGGQAEMIAQIFTGDWERSGNT